ncbi:hypothetical protein FNV43_RR08894 [Rhamnella rubrinervis]|uniref:Protein root UVB sensitive 5 n=1 Tax=Rhamnella rubrinervis TaxID=2594499 RepID=A0A8K0H948_9ROSA|nr:hypothetical protein FNV43_RR08894 [Rhamnella rubrinervis]
MALTLQLSLPTCASEYLFTRSTSRTPPRHLQIVCSSTQSSLRQEEEDNQSDHCRSEGQPHVILVERYANGAAKRIETHIDGSEICGGALFPYHSELLRPMSNKSDESQSSYTNLYWLPDIVKDFILPAGFPGSVSNDYLPYMLLQFPTNVTAWIYHTLVTSSLLKVVTNSLDITFPGISNVVFLHFMHYSELLVLVRFSGSTAAASAAAIRWVSKDGIGAVGRLFIGGRFGNLFDDDPKQWRLYADFIGSAGSIFDLTTPLYPTYFLPLASLGNFAKAIARGLKDPSFRVIQYHFATAGNLGEVAAKEEVWDVAAQLLGLALGILILDTPGLVRSYPILINLKRARILVKSHVINSSVPGCIDCNREENILLWQRFMKPRIVFGVPLEEVIGGESSVSMLNALLKLYGKEKYILVVNKHERDYFEVLVSFKVGATSVSVLRSIWQTYWLQENRNTLGNAFDQLAHSLLELEEGFEDFMQQLNRSGWNTQQINLKVPKEVAIEELDPIRSHKIEFY